MSKIGTSANKLGSNMQRLGRTAEIAGGFIAAHLAIQGARSIEQFVVGGIEKFFQMEEGMQRLRNAVVGQGKDWEVLEAGVIEALEGIESRTGKTLPVLTGMLSELIAVGIPMEDAIDLLEGAIGVAAQFNEPLEGVIDKFARAFSTDQLGLLEKYGITLEDLQKKGVDFSQVDIGAGLRELREDFPAFANELAEGLRKGEITADEVI